MAILLASLFVSGTALACQFDSDCSGLGATCQKPMGSMHGWCVGEFDPKSKYDLHPPSSVIDLKHQKGISCSEDKDCGKGGRCLIRSGVDGVCL